MAHPYIRLLLFHCFDDGIHIIFDDNRSVGKSGGADAVRRVGFGQLGVGLGVVSDGRGRILEQVAGEDADDALGGVDQAALDQFARAGDAGGAGGFAAEAPATDLGLGVENFLIGDALDHAAHQVEGPETFFQVDRAVDFDGAGQGFGAAAGGVHGGIETVDLGVVHSAAVPAEAFVVDQAIERVGSGGVDDGQARDFFDQAQFEEFGEGLAERAGVAEVAAGYDNPVGNFPVERFEDAEHDGLLAFETERIDTVHQVNTKAGGDFLDAGHAGVEIADELERPHAVIEGLGKFAVGDLAAADEDQTADGGVGGGVDGHAGAGVAGGGAGGATSADQAGVGEGGGHAVVLERAAGVEAFVLEMKAAGADFGVFGDAVGGLEDGLALAEGDDFVAAGEGEQLAEPPDAAEGEGVAALGPAALEPGKVGGAVEFVPAIFHVEQIAALGAGEKGFADGELGAASRTDTFLIGGFGFHLYTPTN